MKELATDIEQIDFIDLIAFTTLILKTFRNSLLSHSTEKVIFVHA
jgi:hypothetical protein